MEISTRKDTFLYFTLAMVVLMGTIALVLTKKPKVEFSTNFEKEIQELKSQSSSDEIYAIEKDIMETDLSEIDKELTSIEKELESVY